MSCILDLWADTVKKVSYMSITTHYFDDDYVSHDRTLHVNLVRVASHTAIMVLDEFTEVLEIFDRHYEEYANILVISDSGSNCCSAEGIPSKFSWLPCMVHKLATGMTTILNKTTRTANGVKGKF